MAGRRRELDELEAQTLSPTFWNDNLKAKGFIDRTNELRALLNPFDHLVKEVEELEKQGQIRNTGGGFYELVEKAKPIKGEGRVDVKGEVIPLAELPPDPVAPGTGESQADEAADVADDAEQHAETSGEQ